MKIVLGLTQQHIDSLADIVRVMRKNGLGANRSSVIRIAIELLTAEAATEFVRSQLRGRLSEPTQ